MSRLPSKIYPVVDHPRWVETLGSAGARFIELYLRDLDLPEEELRAQAITAQELAVRHNVTLVLNTYWQIAIELGYEWVHLGPEDLATADLTTLRNSGIRLGTATHTHTEFEKALAISPDYISFGPVWETKSVKTTFAPQGLERLKEWRGLCGDVPLVAIGGVTLEHLPACLEAGADSVAGMSGFMKQDDPEGQVRRWLEAARSFPA
ncbi:thiamine phosphate synthase [Gluconobacter morbifer]|uniref:Thiamin-phosphate pyrophosphorylase n=1 Tax=Gluconobacter morbifer G707 TaxID=1088869 RepID=G6XI53_9PROT|nr:thiamine phosphate synthase [Gluconobacter morbifer]EHH68493.1 thiamin-phosphate pyrophosphorylase [Gluconobacter morbifer G707]